MHGYLFRGGAFDCYRARERERESADNDIFVLRTSDARVIIRLFFVFGGWGEMSKRRAACDYLVPEWVNSN